ncbi:MAG: type II toxin-antitoxin system RelE/ParE family toxin [Candidatus Gastranaerophilales bacterium]|nr:type II toxin-antitoxin system RelE/ParE family toxin [Candidatus Gastranaerophilales bacterium]
MIKSFKHKGLEKFYTTGNTKGIQAVHALKLNYILTLLNIMTSTKDLSLPSLRFHQLKGDKKNLYSVTVQANWRITFEYDGIDVYIVDYLDYH